MGCYRAETDEDLRFDQGELVFEPHTAGPYLCAIRLLVDALLPLGHPTEVLDGIGEVHLGRVQSRLFHRLLEYPPRRADERAALDVLTVARLLANHHDRRARGPFTEHRLGRVAVEVAGGARAGRR